MATAELYMTYVGCKASLIPSPHHPLRQRRKSSVVRHRRQSTANSLPSIGMSVLLAGYYPSLFQQFLVQVKHHPGHHSSLSSSCAVFFLFFVFSPLLFSSFILNQSPEEGRQEPGCEPWNSRTFPLNALHKQLY